MINTDTKTVGATARPALSIQVSLETVAYVGAAVLAATIRLIRLDWLPLTEAEMATTMPAWQAGEAGQSLVVPPPPLLYHLERLTFWLFGGGDVAARLVPALAGVAMVLLAARLRPLIGRTGAVVLAVLLAVSPLWVYYSRSVSGDALSAAAVVALLGALVSRGRWDHYVIPIAAAVALAAGGVAYTFVLAIVVYCVFAVLRRQPIPGIGLLADLWPEQQSRREGALAFVLALVLASTGLLTRLEGFGALLESPVVWLGNLTAYGTQLWGGLLLPLLSYAPVTLVFGLIGIVPAARRLGRGGLFLSLWVATGLVVAFIAGSPAVVADLLLPLSLTAAVALAILAESLATQFSWSEDGVMIAILLTVLTFVFIQAVTFADTGNQAPRELAILGTFLAVLLAAIYAVLWGPSVAARVAGTTGLIALGMLAWANGAPLSYSNGLALREPLRPRYVTSDTAHLTENLAQISWAKTRDPNALSTRVDPELKSVLAWPLRNRWTVVWDAAAPDAAEGAIIVPALEEPLEVTSAQYHGQEYAVVGEWTPSFGSLQSFLRWWLQRRGPADAGLAGDIFFERAQLYIRAD